MRIPKGVPELGVGGSPTSGRGYLVACLLYLRLVTQKLGTWSHHTTGTIAATWRCKLCSSTHERPSKQLGASHLPAPVRGLGDVV